MDPAADLLRKHRTITVVGCSATPGKDAHDVPAFMQAQGYRIVPVNPTADEVLGERAVPTLADAPTAEFVNVFRPRAECPAIAEAAVAAGAKALWLQLGIVSDEAKRIADAAGLAFVQDRCIRVTWSRLQHESRAP